MSRKVADVGAAVAVAAILLLSACGSPYDLSQPPSARPSSASPAPRTNPSPFQNFNANITDPIDTKPLRGNPCTALPAAEMGMLAGNKQPVQATQYREGFLPACKYFSAKESRSMAGPEVHLIFTGNPISAAYEDEGGEGQVSSTAGYPTFITCDVRDRTACSIAVGLTRSKDLTVDLQQGLAADHGTAPSHLRKIGQAIVNHLRQ